MLVCTLASGSRGNCTLVSDGRTHLLVDAGVSARRICGALRSLGIAPEALSGVLVTHEHSDHVSGLRVLKKPVYTSPGTAHALRELDAPLREVSGVFCVGTMEVTAFRTPHDTPESCGFVVAAGGERVAVCTDLGHVTDEIYRHLRGCQYLLLESNHDRPLLRTGPYPAFLKDRILGPLGHLSNDAAAEVIVDCVTNGARRVTLCHLSDENNTPDLALGTVAAALYQAGIIPGRDMALDTAPQGGCGLPYFGCERIELDRAPQRVHSV